MKSPLLPFDYSLKVLLLTYLAPRRLMVPKAFPESQVFCKSHRTLAELTHTSGIWQRGRMATANHHSLLSLLGGH